MVITYTPIPYKVTEQNLHFSQTRYHVCIVFLQSIPNFWWLYLIKYQQIITEQNFSYRTLCTAALETVFLLWLQPLPLPCHSNFYPFSPISKSYAYIYNSNS